MSADKNRDPAMKDFLGESRELLRKLDRDFLALGKEPSDSARLTAMLRCLRVMKGAANYFDFAGMRAVATAAEGAVARLRQGGTAFTPELARALANLLQLLWEMRSKIERTGIEGQSDAAAPLIKEIEALGVTEGPVDALKTVERLSLDLVVKGKIDGGTLEPGLRLLRRAMTDTEGHSLVERLAGAKDYRAAVEALEALTRHLRRGTAPGRPVPPPAPPRPETAAEVDRIAYDPNTSREILNSFFSEAGGHLETIEQQALHLETAPGDAESLAAAFRAMHSLKGLAGFLNAGLIHQLAHDAEAVMDQARRNRRGVSPGECNVMLRAVDCLREMIGLVAEHRKNPAGPFLPAPESFRPFLAELGQMIGEPGTAKSPAASVQGPGSAPDTAARPAEADRLVRVKVEKLDALLDTIGELVVTQTQVNHDPDLKLINSPRLARNLAQLGKTARNLQAVAMSLRMHPLRDIFGRMMRLTHDLALKQGKDVQVTVAGEDTEMDKNVIEALVDPLTHLVRNAVDHGVEPAEARAAAGKPPKARITLSARYQGDDVIVEVSDDGPGLDQQKILAKARQEGLLAEGEELSDAAVRNLIFRSGFSTAARVSEVSGRGVGLDVVRRNVEAHGGSVWVTSVPGKSCTFTLSLPLTLAIIDGLLVRVGQERYIVPITSVVESFRPTREQILTVQARGELVDIRGERIPLVRLADYAGVSGEAREPWKAIVLIVECRGERCALMADELLGLQQVVIKNLGDGLKKVDGIAGGAVLGDGRVGLILDVGDVLEASRQGVTV